jgi:predicted negative regulator of RcsB-dependent stress response
MRTDDEQLEALKEWWKKYRAPLLSGIIIGAVALFGARGWMSYQERLGQSASAEYEQLQIEMMTGNYDAMIRRGDYLIENYARTPYAVLAAFALARVYVEQGDLAAAANRLQWAIERARTPEMAHIARLRLARVIAADGRTGEALALLEGVEPGAFVASYEELKGDLYAESGQTDRARRAYRNAINALEFGAGAEIVQMKIDGLGTEDG